MMEHWEICINGVKIAWNGVLVGEGGTSRDGV
jgi:hypothetical protein